LEKDVQGVDKRVVQYGCPVKTGEAEECLNKEKETD
jgi:hypothetical protein